MQVDRINHILGNSSKYTLKLVCKDNGNYCVSYVFPLCITFGGQVIRSTVASEFSVHHGTDNSPAKSALKIRECAYTLHQSYVEALEDICRYICKESKEEIKQLLEEKFNGKASTPTYTSLTYLALSIGSNETARVIMAAGDITQDLENYYSSKEKENISAWLSEIREQEEDFGSLLKRKRKERKISLDGLCYEIDREASRTTLSRIERGYNFKKDRYPKLMKWVEGN